MLWSTREAHSVTHVGTVGYVQLPPVAMTRARTRLSLKSPAAPMHAGLPVAHAPCRANTLACCTACFACRTHSRKCTGWLHRMGAAASTHTTAGPCWSQGLHAATQCVRDCSEQGCARHARRNAPAMQLPSPQVRHHTTLQPVNHKQAAGGGWCRCGAACAGCRVASQPVATHHQHVPTKRQADPPQVLG